MHEELAIELMTTVIPARISGTSDYNCNNLEMDDFGEAPTGKHSSAGTQILLQILVLERSLRAKPIGRESITRYGSRL